MLAVISHTFCTASGPEKCLHHNNRREHLFSFSDLIVRFPVRLAYAYLTRQMFVVTACS